MGVASGGTCARRAALSYRDRRGGTLAGPSLATCLSAQCDLKETFVASNRTAGNEVQRPLQIAGWASRLGGAAISGRGALPSRQ